MPTNDDNIGVKDTFELIREISTQERHFNELCSKFKALASTWLLSTFAGIGFILTKDIQPTLLFVAGISFGGAIGIYLLWLIDLRVYQQLLAACFIEGLKLEEKNAWLPRYRHNMVDSQMTGSVTFNISWFYILGTFIPFTIGTLTISRYLLEIGWSWAVISAIIAIVISIWLIKNMFLNSEEVKRKYYLKDSPNVIIPIIIFGSAISLALILFNLDLFKDKMNPSDKNIFQTASLKPQYDYLAPDSSEIRLLAEMKGGGIAHCTLPAGRVSKAMSHRTVDEIWFVLNGKGEMWRKNNEEEEIVTLSKGISVTIPKHTAFQFRNTGNIALEILITTMPPWPGPTEAVPVEGIW